MKKTKNYAMPYPEQDDYFNVEDFQDMMVSVDDLMKKLSDSGAQISSDAEHLYNQTKAQMDNIQKRMNAFTALKEGSTTGDAELTDIRVAYDGKEYGNAGEAVREQASDIHKALFGAGASIWSKAKSESKKYVVETKGICILNERFTAAGVVAKISRGTFAQNESTLNLDRECSAYIVEFEKNPGTVYMPSAETIKIVSTTKIIFEANGNARCWIPVKKGQYLAVDSTATAYTSESNHVPYMLYDQANKTLECRGFGSTGSIEPVAPYSLALEYKLEYDMDDTGLVKQIDANREAAASLKEDLGDISGNLNNFFGIRFNVEKGALNSDTGAESQSDTRCRTGFLNLKEGYLVKNNNFSIKSYLIKYSDDKNSVLWNSGGFLMSHTVPSDGLYRLSFNTGNVSDILRNYSIITNSDGTKLIDIDTFFGSTDKKEETFHDFNSQDSVQIANFRGFTFDTIEANCYIESISFHQRSLSVATNHYIEIWGVNGKTLTLLDTITYQNTVSEEKDVTIRYGKSFDVPTKLAVRFGNETYNFTIFAMSPVIGNSKDIRTTDKTSTTLNIDTIKNIGYRINISAKVVVTPKYNSEELKKNERYNIVKIGKYEKFTQIQDALDIITDDSPENHYIFELMPGVYEKFDMTKKPGLRYISIIGKNKHDCIVRDDSGQYYNAPALVFTNGLIKNITFIATHDNPPDMDDRENEKHKSYAVHMDCGTQDVLYEDCVFISYQAPAVGIGCWQDVKYHFKNCEMYSYAPPFDGIDHKDDYKTNFSYLTNYGALFIHSNTSNNITGQRLILDNCRMYSQNGDKGLWIATAGEYLNSDMKVSLINNMAISMAENGIKASIDSKITVTPDSYGNNWDDTGTN